MKPPISTSTPPTLRTLLLFPHHLSPSPTTIPLLTALQSLLNISYTATYCARPGISYIRLADPAKFADLIGADGFSVAVFAVRGSGIEGGNDDDGDESEGGESADGSANEAMANGSVSAELVDLVATASISPLDAESLRRRAQSTAASRRAQERSAGVATDDDAGEHSLASGAEELDLKLRDLERERRDPRRVHELCAFAVAPGYQGLGIGAGMLRALEWLLSVDGDEVLGFAKGVDVEGGGGRMELWGGNGSGGKVCGVDLDEAKRDFAVQRGGGLAGVRRVSGTGGGEGSVGGERARSIVLVAIREIGNEDYYLRRGYESTGVGVVALGGRGGEGVRTLVYMGKCI